MSTVAVVALSPVLTAVLAFLLGYAVLGPALL